jgi:dethiobiotin synthetase
MEMELPKAKGFFITGTDTDIGKTVVAGGIAKILSQGSPPQRVGVFKPVASGCRKQREGLVNDDAEFLANCANCQFSLSEINPVGFITPAAPIVCEEIEHRKVDFEQIATAYKYICQNSDVVIVEGIGGLLVPISDGVNVLQMAKWFDLSVVIVARPGLGTINHTLLTIDAARKAGLDLAGVVINGYDVSRADTAIETAPEVIAQLGDTQILSIVPFDEDCDVANGRLGDAIFETLQGCDWAQMAGL